MRDPPSLLRLNGYLQEFRERANVVEEEQEDGERELVLLLRQPLQRLLLKMTCVLRGLRGVVRGLKALLVAFIHFL